MSRAHPRLIDRLRRPRATLDAAYRRLAALPEPRSPESVAAEWLLDNYYVVERAFRLVADEFPADFECRLPRSAVEGDAAAPVAYLLARELVTSAGFHVDVEAVMPLLGDFQAVRPLTIAEVWALPILLRIVLLERLAGAADEIDGPRRAIAADASVEPVVAGCIRGLRAIETADWKAFFERISETERILRDDPSGVYPRMSFETRDCYRKAVEELAARSDHAEEAVAREAVRRAREHRGDRGRHVGQHLIDAGFEPLAEALGYRATWPGRWRRCLCRHPTKSYLGAIAFVTLVHELALVSALVAAGTSAAMAVTALVLAVPALLTIAVSVVDAVVTRVLPPRVLPRMDFSGGVPADSRTVIAVPVLLSDAREVAALLSRIEIHWLASADPHIALALLTDFPDAPTETMPEDSDLLARARAGITALNLKYGAGGGGPFHLLHRSRRWNPAEGCWMGWERKRGKLAELDRLLAGDRGTSFAVHVGDPVALADVRFVITLDADTEVPRDAARRLAAALAHPLNHAEFDERSGRVTAGYTVLQPRIEVKPRSAGASPLSRILAGDTGLDLYSRSVSDVYQDLFGDGIYVGKGIYEPAAFDRALRGRVPENALLSHDLFEGVHGRVGLLSDVVLLEDSPSDYLSYSRRLRRWARGDWQLLPWLGRRVPLESGGKGRNPLSLIARWKIADNLRRTLLPPTLLAFLLLVWLAVPGSALVWTALALLVLATPAVTDALGGLVTSLRAPRSPLAPTLRGLARTVRTSTPRWLLHVVFLPDRAAVFVDACVRTLVRIGVTRRHLLAWTSAAATARAVGGMHARGRAWGEMAAAPLVAAAILLVVTLARPGVLPIVVPLVLAWLASPEIALHLSAPRRRRAVVLDSKETRAVRRLARRTWLFFETFVGPEDQWLPPDHFQEHPRGDVARRTSPTNIGMLQLATLCAHDLGYASPLTVALRLRNTFDTLARLERYRGHFYNWYDTRDLTPLAPRYVSTVDSGNLAASLIAVRHACVELRDVPMVGRARWDGVLDTCGVLAEAIDRAARTLDLKHVVTLRTSIASTRRELGAARDGRIGRHEAVTRLAEALCPALERDVLAAIEAVQGIADTNVVAELGAWSAQLRHDLGALRRDLELSLPWETLMATRPPAPRRPEAVAAWAAVEACAVGDPTVAELPRVCDATISALARLQAACVAGGPECESVRDWATRFAAALVGARDTADALLTTLVGLEERSAAFVEEMEFGWLYDASRRLFHIGYDVDAGAPDAHHYDLLASEARVASFIAIAKGEAPEEHWLQLGRPFGRVDGATVLLSWSGTMFEYLMPSLLLREGEDSLIGHGTAAAVDVQRAYGRRRGVPWGVSESGYYRFDAQQSYQYRAFGVPDLGFKRGLEDDLVIAPYASVLALRFAPRAALANIAWLRRLGAEGRYGLYEAIDFTASRLPPGQPHAIVRSFMAHHQGMSLCALANVVRPDAMVRRFHADPAVRTAEALLFERPALAAPLERTRPEPARRTRATAQRYLLEPWPAPADSAFPQSHVLSNGRYRAVVTARGGGASQWGDLALTRSRADATLEDTGFRVYVRDRDRNVLWSPADDVERVLFHAHAAEIHHHAHGLAVTQRICVASGGDVEIRELVIANRTASTRHLEVTSYAEVVLGDEAEDRRHPAFAKLFVESEYVDDLHALLFHRRARAPRELDAWLLHMLVLPPRRAHATAHESAREAFVGRGRTLRVPAALDGRRRRPRGTTGATLDPIMSLSADIALPARGSTSLAYVLIAAESRAAALAVARRHRSPRELESIFELARRRAVAEVAESGIAPADLATAQRLLSLLLVPHHALRAPAELLARNRAGQASLWRHGISGDLPILLVRAREAEDAALLERILHAHRLWRGRGVAADIVVLDEHPGGYSGEVGEAIARTLGHAKADAWPERRGGVFVIRARQITGADRILLLAAARVVVDRSRGSLEDQLTAAAAEPTCLPPLIPSRAELPPPEALEREAAVSFDNGLGGLRADGREYVIHLGAAGATPAPWVNVVANRGFGFVVSESGGGYTWAENSGERRLTPWRNDPVLDEPGEAVYLRDEETGAFWSPTPRPAPAGGYEVRHGAGYTVFRHRSHGLDQSLRLWVAADDPIKIVELGLVNRLDRPRRITVTYYVEWVLGTSRDAAQAFVVPEFDAAAEILLARNPWNEDFAERVAFVAASERLHSLTADRAEFLGRHGTYAAPAALGRIGLASTVRAGADPCAALQVHVDIAPGAAVRVHFVLGEAATPEAARDLVMRYRTRGDVDDAWAAVGRRWDALLDAVEVHTPDPALDALVNRWLPYQTLVSRLWGRTGYYQSSGAFGFRDQLQDAMALVHFAPALCRAHVLEAARHQFEEGDVLHWWHPPSGAGVRTRCSDDLLWLPFVTAHYVAATADETILSEQVGFLSSDPLDARELERYGRFPAAARSATLYEHCLAALARGRTAGPHGLPLFGGGDWNDGMNRVGVGGRGESVWLGWFLHATLSRFAPIAALRGDPARADELRRHAEELRRAIEASAWDGAWYRRGYYDDGTPLGSAASAECRIDSLAQSWAVLSSAADPQRAAEAMAAVERELVRKDGLVLLFAPPFHGAGADPGYVRAYPPGVRENGGQYTHAAIWVVWALAELGDADRAVELFGQMLPLRRAATPETVALYRVEPYVLAADVYGAPPWEGRGGWTWYTGAAAWAYRFVLEVILGIRPESGAWRIAPRIPRAWPGFEIVLRDGSTVTRIGVENPRGVGHGITSMLVDGEPVAEPCVPRRQDGATHEVRITLG